jgi:hypothetical protein
MFQRWLLVAVAVSVFAAVDAAANCRGEIEGNIPNQIGTVVLFSSRGTGARNPLYGSEFWAITGPYDTGLLRSYPVEFSPHLMTVVESWDWERAAAVPLVVSMRVDGVLRGEHVWLIVKEVLSTDDEYNDAIGKYPGARRGTCGSLFRPDDA